MLLYTPGKWAAGTPQDTEAMRAAALEGWVLQIRRNGQRLPAHRMAESEHLSVLCIDRYGEPDRFVVRLFPAGQFIDYISELHGARLVRVANGCHQFHGDEWDPVRQLHNAQTLVCAPTRQKAFEILTNMGEQDLRRHGIE